MKKLFFLSLFLFFIVSKSNAEYMCYSPFSSTTETGTIYDSGGINYYYGYGENCGFLIQPPSATEITLSFDQFNVEPASSDTIWDYLEIYDGASIYGTLLGRFYGATLPSSITATSGSMYLRFRSDTSWGLFPGFIANWTSTTGSGSSCETVKDNFSSLSYNNNDGTQNWSNSWQEVGESDGVSAGKARIRSDLCTYGYCLRLGTPLEEAPSSYTNRGVSRQVDLSSYTSASLSFNYFQAVASGSSTVELSISNNGGTSWTLLETYSITASNYYSNTESFDITPYISANTQIRLLGSGSSSSITGMYIDNIQIESCSAAGGGDTPATAFNCVENDIDGISGNLFTKTTGQSFSFDIVALQDTSSIETSFASGADHTVTVELVNAETAASCGSYPALDPPISQDLTFTSSNAGIKASANMTSSKAYSKVKCRITDATNIPSVIGCSTDSFTIRPTAITLLSNLTSTDSSGTIKAKAGSFFTLSATATMGYNGTPIINNANIQAHTGATQKGYLYGSFNPAVSATGIAVGSTFNYSEVGLLRFNAQGVYDNSFTVVDQNGDCTDDFSNTVVAGKVGCKFGNTSNSNYFGRFTPDHFDVTLNPPVFSSSCGTFTYLGQALKYAVNPVASITAKNVAGFTTQNYTGNFWKIDPSLLTPIYNEASHALTLSNSITPVKIDNGDGTGQIAFANTSDDILAILKGSVIAPFDAEIALAFNLTDTDSIVVTYVDGVAQINPVSFGTASAGNGIGFNTNKSHRWGRLNFSNTHGSELTPLTVPVFSEFYSGSSFVKSTDDNCTVLSLANNFSISDTTNLNCSFVSQTSPVSLGAGSVKATLSSNTLSNGQTELMISDNSNSLKGSGTGNTGSLDITSNLTTLPWLKYDWNGDTVVDNCPTAKATFGIYKGNEKQIYFREVY